MQLLCVGVASLPVDRLNEQVVLEPAWLYSDSIGACEASGIQTAPPFFCLNSGSHFSARDKLWHDSYA